MIIATFNYFKQENYLARKSLNPKCLSLFKEARLFRQGKKRELVFFFKNEQGIIFFERDKKRLLERLRQNYKLKKRLYEKEDFIFYDIKAKTIKEIRHRDEESQKILERGLKRLELILKTHGKEKHALSA